MLKPRRLLRLAAGAADARGRVDDQASRFDDTSFDQRLERQDRGGGVAARRGDSLGLLDRLAVKLGNTVDELPEQLGRLMGVLVPALVGRGIVEPEIRAEIDEREASVENAGREPLAVPMRKRGEDQVDIVKRVFAEFLDRRLGIGCGEMWMDGAKRLPGLAVAKQLRRAQCADARRSAAAARRRHSPKLQGWPSES